MEVAEVGWARLPETWPLIESNSSVREGGRQARPHFPSTAFLKSPKRPLTEQGGREVASHLVTGEDGPKGSSLGSWFSKDKSASPLSFYPGMSMRNAYPSPCLNRKHNSGRKSMFLSGRNEAGAEWMSPGGGNGLGAVLTPDLLFMRQRGMPSLGWKEYSIRAFWGWLQMLPQCLPWVAARSHSVAAGGRLGCTRPWWVVTVD